MVTGAVFRVYWSSRFKPQSLRLKQGFEKMDREMGEGCSKGGEVSRTSTQQHLWWKTGIRFQVRDLMCLAAGRELGVEGLKTLVLTNLPKTTLQTVLCM